VENFPIKQTGMEGYHFHFPPSIQLRINFNFYAVQALHMKVTVECRFYYA